MESLVVKYRDLVRLLEAFRIAIDLYHEMQENQSISSVIREALRDSVIKRFELSYDLSWKYLREYIGISQGTYVDAPRKVFDLAYQYGIISEEEVEKLFKMIKNRNLTTHVYNVTFANEMAESVQEYYELIHVIAMRMSPDTIKEVVTREKQ